ncbi:MAG: DUF4259 domain-containing protein [Pseudomonadota bacterium]
MGTWGTGNFENDDAADFVCDFADGGIEAVRSALEEVLKADDYLDAYVATTAVAAAEFVSAANGDDSGLSEDAKKVFTSFAGDKSALAGLKPQAHQALLRVLADNSELIELWEEDGVESEDCVAAKEALENLRQRVA